MHITRTLIADKGGQKQRTLLETELDPVGAPYILLGEPGSGKTELTRALAERLGAPLTPAGSFTRQHDLGPLKPAPGGLLIIDALDEVAPQAGGSTLGEVLRKLSVIGLPPFLLSCRAIDWEGSADRHQIRSDYGIEPTTLHIEPLTAEEAARLLAHHAPGIDPEQVLRELEKNGLEELWGNPLTVKLLAEVAKEGGGLPTTKTDLFQRACEILVREENEAHQGSVAARARVDDLLDSGGAICAAIILGSLVGVSRRPAQATPPGFAPFGEIESLPDAPLTAAALSTRLFRDAGENLFTPMHRVIAEFLGARWLARRVSSGLSARRVFAALEFAGGVPTALRGLHAWLANHQPGVADRCIAADPYGVLRYGDPAALADPQASQLLKALANLAVEDPWFRRSDWSVAAARGLVRPRLKEELLSLVTGPNRHYQLSTLLLGSIGESPLAGEFAEELLAIARDRTAIYAERRYAMEALASGKVEIDWAGLVREMLEEPGDDSERLAVETATAAKAKGLTDEELANLTLRYLGLVGPNATKDEDEHDTYVFGVIDHLLDVVEPERAGRVLDIMARDGEAACKAGEYQVRLEFGRTIRRLAADHIEGGGKPSGQQLWTWLSLAVDNSTSSRQQDDVLSRYGAENETVRRDAQAAAIADRRFGKGPWMALARYLPGCRAGLQMTPEDAIHFMRQIRRKETLTAADADAWDSIMRALPRPDGALPTLLRDEAERGAEAHEALALAWDKFTKPPKTDWAKEERRRSRHRASRRRREFEKTRVRLRALHNELVAGELQAIAHPAMAYMGRYSDINNEASPRERLEELLGPELAAQARRGFVNTLDRGDLPAATILAEAHANGRYWYVENVIKAGLAELATDGRDFKHLRPEVLKAALVSWWHFPDYESSKLKVDLGEAIEEALFTSPPAVDDFLRTYFEPYLKANHEHISGLYRTARNERLRKAAGALALEWLDAYPDLRLSTVRELIELAIDNLPPEQVRPVVRRKLADASITGEARDAWLGASFAVDWPTERETMLTRAAADKTFLWVLRPAFGFERHALPARNLKPEQYAVAVQNFARAWPYVGLPGRRGDDDGGAWEASELIRRCLNTLANDPSAEARAALESLTGLEDTSHADEILHVRADQQRRQRDSSFQAPSIADVRALLTGGLPGRIDDLRAVTLDVLAELQLMIHGSETDEWRLFWEGRKPKDENTCRDVLVSLIRARFPPEIQVLPETLMPGSKRADAVVLLGRMGLPIEIKGQWHREVWTACVGQLDALYTPSWRAEGRGIYLVFWFGDVAGSNPPGREDHPRPKTAEEMREQIIAGLDPSERERIDVVVIDVSRPSGR